MRGISSPGSSFRSSVGRGLAPAVPEGFVLSCRARPPGRAVSVVFRRGFRRLRAASFFPCDGKETNGPGHLLLALGLRKIRANAAPFPRLSLPNQRYRFRETGYLIRPLRGHLPLKGKAKGCHFKAFPFRGRWHGEAVTDEAGGQRPPAGRRGRRPLRKDKTFLHTP